MRTEEHKRLSDAAIQGLKQASMERTLAAAREASANGTLKKRPRPANIPYIAELRVK